jgi:hypothetical protein
MDSSKSPRERTEVNDLFEKIFNIIYLIKQQPDTSAKTHNYLEVAETALHRLKVLMLQAAVKDPTRWALLALYRPCASSSLWLGSRIVPRTPSSFGKRLASTGRVAQPCTHTHFVRHKL